MFLARLIFLNGCWTSILAGLQAIPLIIALVLGETQAAAAFAASIGLFMMLGGGLFLGFRKMPAKQSSALLILLPITGMITAGMAVGAPFYFWDDDLSLAQGFYEGVSLVTTSGASVLEDLNTAPTSLSAWRAIAAWLSGFAAMVTVLVVFTHLNLGAARLHVRVAVAAPSDDVVTLIERSMKSLFPLYALTTLLIALILAFGGWPLSRCLYLAMGAVSLTGLPVTQDINLILSNGYAQTILGLAMLMAMLNWDAMYARLQRAHYDFASDQEAPLILAFLAGGLLVGAMVLKTTDLPALILTITSALSSTGWSAVSGDNLSPGLTFLLIILMSVGGSMVSASGGIRQLRFKIMWGLARRELGRLAYPSGIHPIKIGRNTVQRSDVDSLWLLLALVTLTLLGGTLLLGAQGTRFDSAFLLAIGHITLAAPMVTTLDPDFFGFAGLYDGELMALALLLLVGRVEATILLLLLGRRFLR